MCHPPNWSVPSSRTLSPSRKYVNQTSFFLIQGLLKRIFESTWRSSPSNAKPEYASSKSFRGSWVIFAGSFSSPKTNQKFFFISICRFFLKKEPLCLAYRRQRSLSICSFSCLWFFCFLLFFESLSFSFVFFYVSWNTRISIFTTARRTNRFIGMNLYFLINTQTIF